MESLHFHFLGLRNTTYKADLEESVQFSVLQTKVLSICEKFTLSFNVPLVPILRARLECVDPI